MPLPILFKVRDKRLVLKGYGLNQGLCESLSHSLQIFPELLDGIYFTNNGISDANLATVLKGLTKLKSLKSIVIKDNIFLGESNEVLYEIL